MKRGRRICESLHLTALGIWLGAVIMAATAAIIVFPTMKRLDPSLPGFAPYPKDQWLIAGGQVAARVFWACDVVQFAGMLVAGATFAAAAWWFGLSVTRVSTFVRAALLLTLLAVLSYRLGFLEPRMGEALKNFWAAAQGGDVAAADRFKAIFDAGHPMQSRLMVGTAIFVLASLVASTWSIVTGDTTRAQDSAHG